MKAEISFSEFESVDLRVGVICYAAVSEKAKVPAFKLTIDFGHLGIRTSSARITDLYEPSQLIGKQIIALVNVPPRQVASVVSQCLVLGVVPADGKVVLLQPDPGALPGDSVA